MHSIKTLLAKIALLLRLNVTAYHTEILYLYSKKLPMALLKNYTACNNLSILKLHWIIYAFIAFNLFAACTKSSTSPIPTPTPVPTPTPDSSAKKITAFNLTRSDGSPFDPAEYMVAINPDSIKIVLPPLVIRNGLKASFQHEGKSVSPANGTIQNFSSPVTYTVTAQDGSTKQYTIQAAYANPVSVVFIGAGNTFYALNADNGTVRWSYTGGGSFAYSSATYRDNVVYVGCIDSYVHAFNASNGRLLWKYKLGDTGIESDAVIEDSTVYVGSNDDKMYALDAITGSPRWSFTTGGNISSSPKIANGKVYFGSSDSKFYAVDARTGQLVWQYQTGAMINQSGASLINGNLYFGSRDGYLYSLNANTGTMNWRYGAGQVSFEACSPTVSNNIVYIGGWYNVPGFNVKGSLFAVNANTGSLIWEKLPNTGFSSSPFVSNGRISITGDDLKISVLDASTGNIIWQKPLLANSSSPVEANGVIYVGGGGNGFIYAFNETNGNEIWKFAIPGALQTSSPLVIELSGEINYPGDSGGQN
jgi:outer membrane protein assembly factor BamB